ncbi:MAG: agmatinase family protein [Bacteroidia bacterium]|nr:agmatinase family protein [Bacteroidia bacterium]
MNSKEKKIQDFNPNDIGDAENNIYGLPFTPEEADLVIIPVPWEVTVSYSAGTAAGPEAIYEASYQVDLYDSNVENAWKMGVAMLPVDTKIAQTSKKLRKKAEKYIDMYAVGKTADSNKTMHAIKEEIDLACLNLNKKVKKEALKWINKGKLPALLGGDHSTPLGLMQALAEKHSEFGILQIDAHADLRNAYEGFTYSHASIMFNALKIKEVKSLVQVGIRDYCQDEKELIDTNERVKTFFDSDIKAAQYAGKTWKEQCADIINSLPQKIYLSIDIDGLDPKLCPNTGTPVPGGFEFEQVVFLVKTIVESNREIIGFDINEVAPGEDEWDANVGARLLYKVGNLCLLSRNNK